MTIQAGFYSNHNADVDGDDDGVDGDDDGDGDDIGDYDAGGVGDDSDAGDAGDVGDAGDAGDGGNDDAHLKGAREEGDLQTWAKSPGE